MLKLARYLKPYRWLFLAAILLLFVQANADLTLPDYLSRIVNIGIQQGGVEETIPRAIRQNTLEKALLFLTPEEQTQVQQAYLRINSTSPEFESYLAQYPALANEPIYILKPLDPPEVETLSPLIRRGLLTVSFLQQALSDPEKAQKLAQSMGFDLSKLPPGVDLFTLLGRLPAEQRTRMVTAIQERLDSLGENMLRQMTLAAIKAEYEALGMDTTRLQFSYILRIGGMMLLVTLVSISATILVSFLASHVGAGLARDLRRAFFVRVSEFSSADMSKFSTASLITRSTNDVTQLQMVTMLLMRLVFFAPVMSIGATIRAIDKALSMWWIIALMAVILICLIVSVFTITLPKFKLVQTLIDRLNRVVRENLEGMMVVRAFNRQDFEEARFDRANRELADTILYVSRIMVTMMPVMMFSMSAVSLLILWVGAHQVEQAQIQVGDMMAFMQYAMQIFFSFMFMSMMFVILPRASISAERIVEVLETEPSIKDPPHPKHFPEPFRGVVEFHNVCFRYPDAEEDVLHNICFTACPGEVTAFIGTTGSGKSTIVNLIPRFYDVTSGAITIDGIDIREVPQHELRAKIGYVPQKSILFSGTIESNLRYGDERATPEDLQWAAAIAQAEEFIVARPEGLQAEIAQGGMNVSGGQRQRLAIARALVKRAPIYIFDDSFSSLDFKTEAALRRALRKHLGSSTVFIVTQRVATIKNADQIIVLDEGRIIGKGKHHELIETCDVYRNIALSQLGQEALA